MRRALAALVLLAPGSAGAEPVAGPVRTSPASLCAPAIEAAERRAGLPDRLLRSVALVESGRVDPLTGRVVPWPWTVNAAGTGRFHATKDEAVAAVRALQASGIRSIDVGCAQINLLHHPDAFASLDLAFDPTANADYAASFLKLLGAGGSWLVAVAAYHSRTAEIGQGYARKVMAVWPAAARYGPSPSGSAAAPKPGFDYSAYTPEFAARLRRMDEDRAKRVLGTAVEQAAGSVRSPAALPPAAPPGGRLRAERRPRAFPG